MKSTDVIRLEHKLDAILFYLKELTGKPARPMPQPIPGMSGMSDGVCPITGSPITYHIDVTTGDVRRSDALAVRLVEAPLPKLPAVDNKSVMLSSILDGGGGDD